MSSQYGGRRPVLAVEGAAELRRTMKRAEHDVGELRTVHREVAEIVADEARRNPPEDPFTPDGVHIAKTIRATATRTRAEARAGNNTKVTYGPTLHYGAYGSRPRAETQPFLTDAAHDSEADWLPVYERHMTRIIDRIHGA